MEELGILGRSATSMRAVCLEAELLQHAKSLVAGKLLGGSDAGGRRAQRRGNQPGERRIRRFHRLFHGPPARRGLCPLAGQGLRDGAERPHLLRRGVARRGGLEPGESAAPGPVHPRNAPCLAAPAWRQRPSGGGLPASQVQFLLGEQYAYRLEPGKTLKDYNIEQQGDIVRDYFLEKNESGKPLRTAGSLAY